MPNFSLRRDAFSMLELVFVIVILAIVASIGSQIIVKVYDSYITQRAIHRSSLKTELAATQLANRLAYSIPGTVIGRSQANPLVLNAVQNIPVNAERDILEWIAYDSDSFGAVDNPAGTGLQRSPVWSGYADVDAIIAAGNRDEVLTPGSRLTDLAAIIGNLSGGGSNVANTAVFFPDGYHAHNVGYIEAARDFNGSHQVAGINGDTTITLDNRGAGVERTFREHYKLAWTAYAVVPVQLTNAQLVARGFDAGDNLWDLELHYDYQPWDGESLNNANIQVLIRNVSVFNYTGTGDTIRFKICQRESIGGAFSINTCKEKAVIR